VFDICLEKIDHRGEGVVVGNQVEIEGAADKVGGAVGEVELVGGSRVGATDLIDETVDLTFGVHEFALADGIGFWNVLVDQRVGILEELAQVFMNRLVADVKLGMKRLVGNIDPVGLGEAGAVAQDLRVNGVFKSKREGSVEDLVFFLRQIDTVVTPWLGDVAAAAGGCEDQNGKEEEEGELLHGNVRFVICDL